MSDYVPSNKMERSALLLKTGANVGGQYLKHGLRNAFRKKEKRTPLSEIHTQNARTIFDALTQLRGTALKLAQGLSMDTGILPEEFADIFAGAQYNVPPINRALVRSLVRKELGKYPEQLFKSFNSTAKAAASIGQAHEAELMDGRKVIVKVQYPGVRDSISSDLAVVKGLIRQVLPREKIDVYFEEVRDKLMEETDYRIEGSQISEFRSYYQDEWLEMPEYVEEFSTERLLTMTRLSGLHIDQFLAQSPSQEERNHFGQLLWDFFHLQINDHYVFHADTHPGNYLLTDDKKLGVLDFGCVKRYPNAFFDRYMSLMPMHLNEMDELVWDAYADLEMIFPDAKKQDVEVAFYEFCLDFGKSFVEPYRHASYDFGDKNFMDQLSKYVKEISQFGEPRGSKHFIYTAKTHFGLYVLLHQLGAVVETEKGRERVMDFVASKGYAVEP